MLILATKSHIILTIDTKGKNLKLTIRYLATRFKVVQTTLQANITGGLLEAVTLSS